jgi:hypothetical protein
MESWNVLILPVFIHQSESRALLVFLTLSLLNVIHLASWSGFIWYLRMSAGRAIPRSVRFIAACLHVKFVMDEVALNRLLSKFFWLSPANYHFAIASSSSVIICWAVHLKLQRTYSTDGVQHGIHVVSTVWFVIGTRTRNYFISCTALAQHQSDTYLVIAIKLSLSCNYGTYKHGVSYQPNRQGCMLVQRSRHREQRLK